MVLLVDDLGECRRTLRLLLTALGFEVDEEADGDEGVAAGLELHPNAALFDTDLPGLDGYEVARRLRAGIGGGLRLVALIPAGQTYDRERGGAAGFDGWLPKPADPEELRHLLDSPSR